MAKYLTLCFIIAASITVAGADTPEQQETVRSMPPVVVKTVPQAGDTAVDPNLDTISVTFSKDMRDGSWSWVQASKHSFPKMMIDKIRYLKDNRTCVAQVKLEPGKTYVIWFNSAKFQNFKSTDHQPAMPYLLVFQTAEK